MAQMASFEVLAESAMAGDEVAAYELAMAYASGGGGLAMNLVEAHRWFNVAAANGYGPAADWRREIARDMTAREVVEAQRLARATLGRMVRLAA